MSCSAAWRSAEAAAEQAQLQRVSHPFGFYYTHSFFDSLESFSSFKKKLILQLFRRLAEVVAEEVAEVVPEAVADVVAVVLCFV